MQDPAADRAQGAALGKAQGVALMARRTAAPLALLLALALPPGLAASEEKPDAKAEPRPERAVGADAERLLRGMGDFLKAAPQLSFHAEISFDDLLRSGQKVQLAASNDVVLRRPDRIYSEYEGDSDSKRFWYDGKNVTLDDGRHDVYAVTKGAGSIDATLDRVMETLGFTPPLADLMYSDPYQVLRKNVQYGFYVGSVVAGRAATISRSPSRPSTGRSGSRTAPSGCRASS